MATWRAFIGQWGEWAHVDQLHDDYEAGRSRLVESLVRFRDNSCTDCRTAAGEEHALLMACIDGAEFVGEVDGEDYLLVRADRTDIEDLWEARPDYRAAWGLDAVQTTMSSPSSS